MNQCSIFLIPLLFFSSIPLNAQNSSEKSELIQEAASEIIQSVKYCVLITLDESGHPQARTMEGFAPEEDFTLWFGTNKNSRKVTEIRNDSRVTVHYADANGNGYVILTGLAELVDDANEKENHWMDHWEQFYPDRESTYILIKVVPKKIEVVSYSHGLTGDTVTWRAPNVEIR